MHIHRIDQQHENHESFIESAKHWFAFYGFLACPLTDEQLIETYKAGFDVAAAHQVGCDVFAGYGFDEAFQYAKEN